MIHPATCNPSSRPVEFVPGIEIDREHARVCMSMDDYGSVLATIGGLRERDRDLTACVENQ